MKIGDLLSVLIFFAIIVIAACFPYFYKRAVQKRFRKLQESALQYDLFDYVGSISQSNSIFNFYSCKESNYLWFTQKRISGAKVIESTLQQTDITLSQFTELSLYLAAGKENKEKR